MQTEYRELSAGIIEKYGEEILVETSVGTADRGGAEKVLSLEAEAKLTGVELLDKEAEVSGKVNYRLLYSDKQHRLCGLDYFKDFKCRVQGEKITPNGKCSVSFSIPDAEARIEGDDVTFSAMTEVELTYFGEEERRAVSAVTEAECHVGEILTEKVKRSERSVDLEKSAEVGPGVKKIVLFRTDAVISEIVKKEEENEVKGEVRASVIYLNEADEAVELLLSLPFVESFEGGEPRDYRAWVKNARIVLTEEEEGGAVDVEATLVIEELVYISHTEKAVLAVCGETHTVKESEGTLSCRSFCEQGVYTEPLKGTIPLEVPDAYVAFVRPGCHAVAEIAVEKGAVKVEGVSAFQVVYLTEGGYDSVQGELPFSYLLPFPTATGDEGAEVRLLITDPKASYNGKELLIEAKVAIAVSLYEMKTGRYLAEAEDGEPIPESEAGISVYFAESGETVWQIAKAMGVLPSALIKANPFLSEPLTEDKKVLIFRAK